MDPVSIENQNSLSDGSNSIIEKDSKSSDLICLVCGAPSNGLTYPIITCMCCKTFFRRNALYGLESYQCRYLTENCSINILTRRDCSYCRLKKCFQVGMKKEHIITHDVKRLKREKISTSREMTLKKRTNFLNENDSILLRNISNAYEEYCRLPIMAYEKREYEFICHQPLKSRIKFQHYLESFQQHQTSLNAFFRYLPEFQQFSTEEQNALLSHNIRFLLKVNSIETIDDSFPIWGAVNLLLEIIYGKSLVECIDQCLHQFKFQLNDSQCTQLFLIILLFSASNKYNGHINTLVLHKIQEKYTSLLWGYLNERYGGLIAYQKFSLMIRYCLRLQTISHVLELIMPNVQWQETMIPAQ